MHSVQRHIRWSGAVLAISSTLAYACDLPKSDENRGGAPTPETAQYVIPGAPLVIDAWIGSEIEGEEGSATIMPPGFQGIGDALSITPRIDVSLEETFKLHTAGYPAAGQTGTVEIGDETSRVRTIEHRLDADRFVLVNDVKLDGSWHPGQRMVGIVVGGRVYTCDASYSPPEFAETGLEFCKTLRPSP